jgi:hypothetical protein
MAGSSALFDSKGNALPGIHAFVDAAGSKQFKKSGK